jgi:beta-glucanase (GH16 family)
MFQALGLVALALPAAAQELPGRTLVWSDEFTQAENSPPDSGKWGYDIGGSGWGNNELQHYTNRTQNARIENGQLVIEARAENFGGRNYTSARLLTKGKTSWTYGRIEARIKIPRGQGIWPAFWMLGANIDAVSWPNCGEIDIMENIGSLPSNLYGTVHGPGYSGGGGISGSYTLPGAALADDFHIYAIEWEQNRIRWFIDGQLFFTLTPANLPSGRPWVFNQPQFLILNVAVGGNWPGAPNGTTAFPQRMTVDYVRVYAPVVETAAEIFVTADPAENWLGYMNVFDLPGNGGAFRYGNSWPTAELRGTFSGPALTLGPNTISNPDPYWYIGGGGPGQPGNKIMRANMYVEKTDTFSGKNITFSGTVSANTLTSLHNAVAFIKDFAPDYSSFHTVTAPLVNGTFSITLATAAGAGRHVQYGFETAGVNVWATDVGPFGSVQVSAAAADAFPGWISGFDFSGLTTPDLTKSGDPDGDGENNLVEFALDGDPASGTTSGKVRTRTEMRSGGEWLILTLPVRNGAVFSGSPAKSAVVGGLRYAIEGSDGLAVFERAVSEVTPAMAEGMPAPQSGWSYRSFQLEGAVGGPAPSGFLRVRVEANP